jgi:hypothetical protein
VVRRNSLRFFFAAGEQFAGNSNLNLECLRRAFIIACKGGKMRSKLSLQVDNASDNKSRYVIGLLAWMIRCGYVEEVELSMMPVGHTHEDIDQAFRVISEHLRRMRFVGTIGEYLKAIRESWVRESDVAPHVELIECIFDYAGWLAPHLYESSWRPEVSERTTSFRHLLPSPAQRSSRERSRSRWS